MSFGYLTIVLAERISRQNSTILMSKKSCEGMKSYASIWPGKVRLLAQPRAEGINGINDGSFDIESLPFEVTVCDFNSAECPNNYLDSDAVLATLGNAGQDFIAQTCKKNNVACITITEYSLQTKLDINKSTTPNILRRYWRSFKLRLAHRDFIKNQLPLCSGVQCNGVPTYNELERYGRNRLLFFDNRSKKKNFASTQRVLNRFKVFKDNRNPIRLAFSGRLTEMKGVLDLVEMARILVAKNFDFTLSIFGDGNLRNTLYDLIKQYNLTDYVKLKGSVDYETELVPYLIDNVDLFIIPHKQGDPSCTYIETFACGVPILGYANEAFSGMLHYGEFGWQVPISDIQLLSEEVLKIAANKDELLVRSNNALRFAEENCFESVMIQRIEHIKSLLK